MTGVSFMLVGSLRKFKPIQSLTVAKAMVAAAKTAQPSDHVYEYDKMVELAGKK